MSASAIQPVAYGLAEAAGLLSVRPRTLRLWAAQRRIASCKVGGCLRFRIEDLRQFLDASSRPALTRVK